MKPLVLIGGGGHAGVLADILIAQGRNILAVISPDDISSRAVFSGLPQLKRDEDVQRFDVNEVLLVNGVGMLPRSPLKRKLNEAFISLGYRFETVIADSACVSAFASVAAGAQVLTGAIVQAGASVGAHTIVNSGVIVEHDCRIGEYNHIAPGATVCGQVCTGSNAYIGANATIIQNITIEDNCLIGAGAIVTRPVESGQTCYPGRTVIK